MARSDRIDVIYDQFLEPSIQEFQVQVARDVLREEQAQGFDADPRVVVDRRKFDAPLETVKPFGVIQFFARADLGEITEWIWKRLIEKSPVLHGDYQDSHIVMVDGKQVADIRGIQPGSRVQIVNTQPYARKIEGWGGQLNKGSGAPAQSLQAPNGVYRTVYRAAQRRYGKLVFIDYKLVKLNTGVEVTRTRRSGKQGRVAQVYPAIQIFQGAA